MHAKRDAQREQKRDSGRSAVEERGYFFLNEGENRCEALERQITEFIRAHWVIEAVKLGRERTGLGLAAAKDAVDNLRRLHG